MKIDTKYMISVMQAYEDGEEIEYRCKKGRIWIWSPHAIPKWNWDEYDYRIKSETKPEPEYVPYDSAAEVDKDKWIKGKSGKNLYRITALNLNDNSVSLNGGSWTNLHVLHGLYTYEDGTPCGKLVEE